MFMVEMEPSLLALDMRWEYMAVHHRPSLTYTFTCRSNYMHAFWDENRGCVSITSLGGESVGLYHVQEFGKGKNSGLLYIGH